MDLEGRWLAVQVRPRFEKAVQKQLASRGYECLLPLHTRRHAWRTRMLESKLPLIPGYVFCRFTSLAGLHIVAVPGVVRVVGADGQWLPVDDGEIAALQRIAAIDANAEPWTYVRPGNQVEITRGPLAGITGTLLRTEGRTRLIIAVQMLQRSVAVDVEADCAVPLSIAAPRQFA